MIRKFLKSQSSKLSALENAHSSCASKLKVAQELAAVNLKSKKEVQQELKEFVSKVRVMEDEMLTKSQEAVTQQAMRTRVEVMQEFFRGEHTSWDLDEAMRIYNEVYPQDAFALSFPLGGDLSEPVEAEKSGTNDTKVVEGDAKMDDVKDAVEVKGDVQVEDSVGVKGNVPVEDALGDIKGDVA